MKKVRIQLNKKLVLSKEMISSLTEEKQRSIKGGGPTKIDCYTAGATCPWTFCVGCTQTQGPQTNCPPFVCNTAAC